MLQSERDVFSDFTWYDDWVEQAKASEPLKWAKDQRNTVVHAEALATASWARIHCFINGSVLLDGVIEQNPFVCTHYIVKRFEEAVPQELLTVDDDHDHIVVRRWELASMPGIELLAACAEVYDELSFLLELAHLHCSMKLGRTRSTSQRTFSIDGRRLPT